MARSILSLTAFALLAASFAGCSSSSSASSTPEAAANSKGPVELLNVSCDPTRELWEDVNAKFKDAYKQKTGRVVDVKQSHGGSSSQARAVNDGLEADIVSLAMFTDTDLLRKGGLIAEGWKDRSPDGSLPYYSTIVFVVRKGNPKNIHDWPDIVKDGVQIITPNPKTSGNGKLSFLAGWGAMTTRGHSEKDAEAFITKLYKQTPVLDTAARAATLTFSKKNIGDVHLTWENEAQQEVQDSKGELEIVYPPVSFRAEPEITWVDANVKKHGTEDVAKAFVEFLYTPEAQAAIAKHFYRPNAKDSREQYADKFPQLKLFSITDIATNWDEANKRFFDDGGVFDKIYEKK
jgi:sulfate/thiosulfate transport system substrate-binding protein